MSSREGISKGIDFAIVGVEVEVMIELGQSSDSTNAASLEYRVGALLARCARSPADSGRVVSIAFSEPAVVSKIRRAC